MHSLINALHVHCLTNFNLTVHRECCKRWFQYFLKRGPLKFLPFAFVLRKSNTNYMFHSGLASLKAFILLICEVYDFIILSPQFSLLEEYRNTSDVCRCDFASFLKLFPLLSNSSRVLSRSCKYFLRTCSNSILPRRHEMESSWVNL